MKMFNKEPTIPYDEYTKLAERYKKEALRNAELSGLVNYFLTIALDIANKHLDMNAIKEIYEKMEELK